MFNLSVDSRNKVYMSKVESQAQCRQEYLSK